MKYRSLLICAALLCSTAAFADDAGVHDFIMAQAPHAEARLKMKPGRHAKLLGENVGVSGNGHTVLASYYGGGERLNAHTSNGERFRAGGLTAAHRSLPFGTMVQVSRAGRSVVVRINDRGPAAYTGRSIDLSRGAAAQIGLIGPGVGPVRIAVLGR
jgi:rare lipoprotein A